MTMATISHAGGVIEPHLILGFQSSRNSGNIVHLIPGRANPEVSLRPAGLRTGTLELLFLGETESADAENAFATGAVFALSVSERETAEMEFVAAGAIIRELDPQTRNRWIVRVDFQEVTT